MKLEINTEELKFLKDLIIENFENYLDSGDFEQWWYFVGLEKPSKKDKDNFEQMIKENRTLLKKLEAKE